MVLCLGTFSVCVSGLDGAKQNNESVIRSARPLNSGLQHPRLRTSFIPSGGGGGMSEAERKEEGGGGGRRGGGWPL